MFRATQFTRVSSTPSNSLPLTDIKSADLPLVQFPPAVCCVASIRGLPRWWTVLFTVCLFRARDWVEIFFYEDSVNWTYAVAQQCMKMSRLGWLAHFDWQGYSHWPEFGRYDLGSRTFEDRLQDFSDEEDEEEA